MDTWEELNLSMMILNTVSFADYVQIQYLSQYNDKRYERSQ